MSDSKTSLAEWAKTARRGDSCLVVGIVSELLRPRFEAIGFVHGMRVQFFGRSFWGSPIWVDVADSRFALRKDEARQIEVRPC